jgi:hypothetical protein
MPPISGKYNLSCPEFFMTSKDKAAGISALAILAPLTVFLSACVTQATAPAAADGGTLFDDFDYADTAALIAGGWQIRSKQGHPGIEGAQWGPDTVQLVEDPNGGGKRLLRLVASTDGTVEGTRHAQVCHARKYLEGTYATRIRFSDAPVIGPDDDIVVQTFYAVSPLRFDFDPEYSEMDWEYLPNGGWGKPQTRMYSVTWQTVQLKPWKAFNAAHEEFRSLAGWHTLVMQAMHGKTRYFVDGALLDEHGGRNYPVVPMSLNFNLWFSPGGLRPGVTARRVYQQDVDWVFHARNRLLSPEQVDAAIESLRKDGTRHVDTVPDAEPPLPSSCDL